MPKILVTGGCGYIGSHTVVDLIENNYDVVSIDNYSRSFPKTLEGIKAITGKDVTNYAVDLCQLDELRNVFQKERDIVGIIHFAAYKTVPESVAEPLLYYHNNIQSLVNLLKCVTEFGIQHFIFSSSCSVYGNPPSLPVTEDTPLGKAESPYAYSKQIGEQMITDFVKSGQTAGFVLLRYFNPIGAHESAQIGENPIGVPNNLAPFITQTAIGKREKLSVFGSDYPTRDGTCIRDYIHVMDIAHAHTLALQWLMDGKQTNNPEVFNLGSGNGVSVLEAIQAFEQVSGLKLNYEMALRRAGDVVAIYANNTKAVAQLGWEAQRSLNDMMLSAWNWEKRMAEAVSKQ
ncbi:MAG: UDP-glucose 4-epimerase GalE [Chitinophagales bacterium]|nr:UDP-glucose 4-epimerase GalE [Chitinophagales bacterium]